MRASVEPGETVVVVRRALPRPVIWLLWLLAALLGSVVLGFLAGLARPREPDPWSEAPTRPAPDEGASPSPADPSPSDPFLSEPLASGPPEASTPASEDD